MANFTCTKYLDKKLFNVQFSCQLKLTQIAAQKLKLRSEENVIFSKLIYLLFSVYLSFNPQRSSVSNRPEKSETKSNDIYFLCTFLNLLIQVKKEIFYNWETVDLSDSFSMHLYCKVYKHDTQKWTYVYEM